MTGKAAAAAVPMTPAQVAAYVNHKTIEFLEGLAQDLDQISAAAKEGGNKVDHADAHNAAKVARTFVRNLTVANTALMTADPHQVLEVGRAQVPVVQGDGEAQTLLEAASRAPGEKLQ